MNTRPRRQWVRWLRARGLPLCHVAAVLRCDVETIDDDVRIAGRYSRARPTCPFGKNARSPHRHDPQARAIFGATAFKVRTLAGLGYAAGRVAELLALEPRLVSDFISRSLRLRGGDGLLEQPRDRVEARAAARNINRARRRREIGRASCRERV